MWERRKHTLIALFRTLKVYSPSVYDKSTIGYMSPEICGVVQGKSYKCGIYQHVKPYRDYLETECNTWKREGATGLNTKVYQHRKVEVKLAKETERAWALRP